MAPATAAKLPLQQLTILAICRFAEPVASTSVYPYIPEMVASFDVPTDQIGLYSGWLAAVFSLSQAVTGIAWGQASDRLGRKSMILLALLAVLVSSVLFGFSTSLSMAFVARSFQGASSGNVGIIRTTVAEMVPQKELQPMAFSIMPLVWNIGSIFGPSIGGFLSDPVRKGWFAGSELLKKYPYALPNLMIAAFFVVGIVSGFLFLRETHEDKKNDRDYGLVLGSLLTSSCSKRKKRYVQQHEDEADPFLGSDGSNTSTPIAISSPGIPVRPVRKPSWREVFSRQSNINLIAYTGLAMHSMAFDQLMPVFMHHPPESHSADKHFTLGFAGGFGLDSGRIGAMFTVYGISGMLIQFFVFPPFAKKFGVLKCFKVCAVIFPCVYLVVPFTSLLPTTELRQGICLTLMLIKGAAGIFSFPCSTIMLTNSAVSLVILGTLNGVAVSISGVGRAAGPAIVGWAFTYGVDIGYVVVPFWTLVVVGILSAIPVWWLIEMEGPYGSSAKNLDEERDNENEDTEHIRSVRFEDDPVSSSRDGLGILTGTEAIDLFDEDLPLVSQSSQRPDMGGRRRSSSYSMHTINEPPDTISTGTTSGMTVDAAEYSPQLDPRYVTQK